MGAEMLLDQGQYSLGSDEENDIILYDTAIAQKHLTLTIQSGKISLDALEDHVYIEGIKESRDTLLN